MAVPSATRRQTRQILVAAVVAIAVLAVPASASAAAVPKNFIGMIADDVFAGDAAYRAAQLQGHLDAGVGLERYPFAWNTIEKSPGQFDFSYHDAYVAELAKRGLDLLPILVYSPAFRSSAPAGDANPTKWPPKNPADLGAFATAAIKRYGPAGTFWTERPDVPKRPIRAWQVWNEPNIPSYYPGGPEPAEYVKLLKATSSAIKAADPGATVVAAGMSQSSSGIPLLRFVEEMEKGGAAPAYDAMAVHAYAVDDDGAMQRVQGVRNVMSAYGDSKPIWVTEVGWGTAGTPFEYGTDEQGQAPRIGCAVVRLAEAKDSLGIKGLVEYDWRDDQATSSSGHWSNFAGLLRSDGTHKPSFDAFQQSALKAQAAPGVPNRPPVACMSVSEPAPVAGETVQFSSKSTDAPDGTITAQAWDLDNDGSFDDGTGTTASRSFAAPGSYTVRLRATDNGGASHVVSRPITVVAEARVSGSTLYYTAGAGETNNVTLSGGSGSFTIRDSGATMTPGPGCTASSASAVNCSGSINSFKLDLRDGADSVVNTSSTDMTVLGGPGNDTLTGGPGTDIFDQGQTADGADRIVGNGGVDGVFYSGRIKPVRVSLDDQANDGEDAAGDGTAEEADNVASDVENVLGGWADDVIAGSSAANTLDGGYGKDSLSGGSGNDSFPQSTLTDGADTVSGGAGTDDVSYKGRKLPVRVTLDDLVNDGNDADANGVADEGDNVKADVENVIGGLGADRLEGSAAANSLVGYKADDVLLGGGGDDSLDGQSGADSISGGAGVDKALYASRTLPATVDIDGAWDDGTTEDVSGTRRDNVMTDMESITGGTGDDTLTGSAGANTLEGGKGADTLSGLDGADTLLSWDSVVDRQVFCGAGTDSATADSSDPVPTSGPETCETITFH